jgi:plastocyanin
VAIFGAALLVSAFAAPAARADEQIIAGPPSQYLTPQVTIDQGEKVTFQNNDLLEHDVVARDLGSDGAPLFASELIAAGATAPVNGVEYLTTGAYAFFCSIHPDMEGTISVTAAGQPATRPGGSGGGDTKKPGIEVEVLDSDLGRVERKGLVRVTATVDEAVTLAVTARARKKTIAKGKASLGAAGVKNLKLKLTRAGEKLVKRSDELTVKVVARGRDGAGNKGSARTKRTLR